MNTNPIQPDMPKPTGRRRALQASVAVAAALTGAGLAWWRFQPRELLVDAAQSVWLLTFQTPSGAELAMQSFRGRPLLLNFWATWCPPCVEELPLIDAFFQEHASNRWQVVGLAIDQPSAVRSFLQRTPVSFPIGLAGLNGVELGKTLGNLTGSLPFTVLFGTSGKVLQRRIGRIHPADLSEWSRLG